MLRRKDLTTEKPADCVDGIPRTQSGGFSLPLWGFLVSRRPRLSTNGHSR